jgi:hypothetical protein
LGAVMQRREFIGNLAGVPETLIATADVVIE